ncbi:hypothetical protein [Noviherbaspirillum sp.]
MDVGVEENTGAGSKVKRDYPGKPAALQMKKPFALAGNGFFGQAFQ